MAFLRINSNPIIYNVLNYCRETYNIIISHAKVYQAWQKARAIIKGNERDQYSKIWNYCEELRLSNKGTTHN